MNEIQTGGPVARPLAPTTVPMWQQRGDGITLIAGYHFLVAGLFLVGTLILMLPTAILGLVGMVEDPGAFFGMMAVGFVALVTLVLCLVYLAVGYGLWTLRAWARIAAIALAMISLFGIPIGTIAGSITLWHLLRSEVAAKFEPTSH
ncbi:MAG: hypothetical protein KF832_24230 [Caldilineaceae bacterium]|nr:hypothetical protein [Caldilineaceae bacterium]